MVDLVNGIVAYSWVDCKAVHLISTADGCQTSDVSRQIGGSRGKIKAPVAVKNYNKNMQGVDRHDQLRARFSLADRHQFKKYYVKLMLGLMDIALTNAWIAYKMVNMKTMKPTKTWRYDFMDGMADDMLKT